MSLEQTSRVRQAGAVVFRERKKVVLEVLLVRPSSGKDEWLFPKGHIEPNELEFDAALREALEEAGVHGLTVGAVDKRSEFLSKKEPVTVRYYVMECLEQEAPAEARGHVWLPLTLAAEVLTHEDNRRVLRDAMPFIERHLLLSGRGDNTFHDFLLRELEHTTESFLKSEEDGERRVTIFLTLVAGAGAVVGFVLGDSPYNPSSVSWPIIVILIALLVFGQFVLLRVAKRNRTTDQYKEKLRRTRKWFTPNLQDPRRAWVAFDPFEPQQERTLSFGGPRNGGWLEILILINSILGGALAAALVPATSWLGESAAFLVGGITFWFALVARARRLYRKGTKISGTAD
jgi:8-oxo-dGTP pyrophosphatase MutT (NUDIX family)